jgi:succinate-semialdehyde dehydrogenase / glutarate-semialdehyde dehydrogenase
VVTTSRPGEVVEPLLRGGQIRKLSFTGSTQVGRRLLTQCADAVVRASMELGGNAAFIVFDDADLDGAVAMAMTAKMRNMGEACTAANRFLVHRTVAEEFAARLAERMGSLIMGPGTQPGVEVGPLIDRAGRARIDDLVADATARGARLLVGGKIPPGPGHFYPPTVLTEVVAGSPLLETEIFGPVAAIVTFDDEDEAVQAANATESGLAGYVCTRDLGRALRVAERLEVGMVGLNTGLISDPAAPFGGTKQSGLGREGGRLGIDEFLEYKYVAMP